MFQPFANRAGIGLPLVKQKTSKNYIHIYIYERETNHNLDSLIEQSYRNYYTVAVMKQNKCNSMPNFIR